MAKKKKLKTKLNKKRNNFVTEKKIKETRAKRRRIIESFREKTKNPNPVSLWSTSTGKQRFRERKTTGKQRNKGSFSSGMNFPISYEASIKPNG